VRRCAPLAHVPQPDPKLSAATPIAGVVSAGEPTSELDAAWLKQPERGSVLAIKLIVALALLLGRRVARVLLLVPVTLHLLIFADKARDASRAYLKRVLNQPVGFRHLFRHYFTFATVALDRFFLLKERYHLYRTTIEGEELLREILASGKGCLLLGAHMGSFEILRALGTRNHVEMGLVMYEENARMVNTVARAINPELAKCIIPLGRFDSMLKVQERLQQNQWVGILGDRTLDAGAMQPVQFLDEETLLPTAPFRIALMLKCPVVFMLGLYRGCNRYELHFEQLFNGAQVNREERAAAVEEAVQRFAARLEHYCKEAPYNWFNFYDFWHSHPR
jgi:predicted LPLAT superfamily acyltransferase